MTGQEILAKVEVLSRGNEIVKVYVWNRSSDEVVAIEADALKGKLDQLSESEEVLGAIYYSGDNAPLCDPFTRDPAGLNKFRDALDEVEDKQASRI